MAVNKVIYDGETVIDLTGDTLTDAEQLLKGIIAHTKSGNVITGTLEASGGGLTIPTSKIKNIALDSFVLNSNSQSFWVNHSLGERPSLAILLATEIDNRTSSGMGVYAYNAVCYGSLNLCWYTKAELTGNVPYSGISYSKRNCQKPLESTKFYVTGDSSGCFSAGEYLVITIKLDKETI